MRTACLLALVLLAPSAAHAQAPAYQRVRTGAGHPDMRPGYHHGRAGINPNGYGAFYGGYFAPPLVVGSYYQRPYPHHFDYYRYRWGGEPAGPSPSSQVEMMPVADCPCLAGSTPSEAAAPAE